MSPPYQIELKTLHTQREGIKVGKPVVKLSGLPPPQPCFSDRLYDDLFLSSDHVTGRTLAFT